ncbi:unnamed protein product, partial [Polarella glacialis]
TNELMRQAAVARLQNRIILARILALILLAVVIVNVAVWVAYATSDAGGYQWPAWVSFATITAFALVANALLPITRMKGSSLALSIVLGTCIIVNIAVWVIYLLTACIHEGYYSWLDQKWILHEVKGCQWSYPWPLWINASSLIAAVVLFAFKSICRPIQHTEAEINSEMSSSSDGE